MRAPLGVGGSLESSRKTRQRQLGAMRNRPPATPSRRLRATRSRVAHNQREGVERARRSGRGGLPLPGVEQFARDRRVRGCPDDDRSRLADSTSHSSSRRPSNLVRSNLRPSVPRNVAPAASAKTRRPSRAAARTSSAANPRREMSCVRTRLAGKDQVLQRGIQKVVFSHHRRSVRQLREHRPQHTRLIRISALVGRGVVRVEAR